MAPQTRSKKPASAALPSSSPQSRNPDKKKSKSNGSQQPVNESEESKAKDLGNELSAEEFVQPEKEKSDSLNKTSLPQDSQSAITFHALTVPHHSSNKQIHCLRSHVPSRPSFQPTRLIFTHGAGGDLTAAAMVNFSQGFASSGSGAILFQGTMNLKARASSFEMVKQHELQNGLLATTKDDGLLLAYGGRSMGARAAVLASHSDSSIQSLILCSYPLVGPSGDMRDKILLDVKPDVDVLFISGDRDNMCDLNALNAVRGKMKADTWLVRVQGADHGMGLKGGKKLKEGAETVGKLTGKIAADWLRERDGAKRQMVIAWEGNEEKVSSSGWRAQADPEEVKIAEEIQEMDNEAVEGETEDRAAAVGKAEGGRGKRRKMTR